MHQCKYQVHPVEEYQDIILRNGWAAQEKGKETRLWPIVWGSICCTSVRSPTPSHTQPFQIKWEVYFSKNCVARLYCRRYDSARRCLCILWLYSSMSCSSYLNGYSYGRQVVVWLQFCGLLFPGFLIEHVEFFYSFHPAFSFTLFVSVYVVHPSRSIHTATAWKKSRFILLDRTNFHVRKRYINTIFV